MVTLRVLLDGYAVSSAAGSTEVGRKPSIVAESRVQISRDIVARDCHVVVIRARQRVAHNDNLPVSLNRNPESDAVPVDRRSDFAIATESRVRNAASGKTSHRKLAAAKRVSSAHNDDLSMEFILERLEDDLRERSRLEGERPAARDFAELLVEEYIRFPLPTES